MSNDQLIFKEMEPGQYRALCLWQNDAGAWIVAGERENGILSMRTWEFGRLDLALSTMPVLYGILVMGIEVRIVPGDTQPDQAQAPAQYQVTAPIGGGGLEVSTWPHKLGAVNYVRNFVYGDRS